MPRLPRIYPLRRAFGVWLAAGAALAVTLTYPLLATPAWWWERTRLYVLCDTQANARQLAIADVKRGNIRRVAWGLPAEESVAAAELLETRYNIHTIWGGCITNDKVDYYNTTVDSLLTSRLGAHFIFCTLRDLRCELRRQARPLPQ